MSAWNAGSDDGNGGSWHENYKRCVICQHGGFVAFHLRQSQDCLRQLRARQGFQVTEGSDEQYIIIFTMLAGECPSPVCPTGHHSVLPDACFDWWIADGWNILGWSGKKEDADPDLVNNKISEFLLQHHKSRASSTKAADEDGKSGQDVGAVRQEDGGAAGDTLTAKVSRLID